MNKTIASISAAVIVGSTSLSAFVPVPAELGITSDLTFASQYVFRGYEVADKSFQPSLEASLGDFYVGLFGNLPTASQQSELQYYGGFEVKIPELQGVILDVGATVYHWHKSGSMRTHEGFVGARLEDAGIEGLGVGVKYFYDFDRRAHVAEAAIGYSFAIDQDGDLSLDLSAVYGKQFGGSIKNRGLRVNEDYHYYGASAELPFRLNEFSKITPGIHYYTAEDFTAPTRGQNLLWTISYTAGF